VPFVWLTKPSASIRFYRDIADPVAAIPYNVPFSPAPIPFASYVNAHTGNSYAITPNVQPFPNTRGSLAS
jgi:hypothetical protein